MIGIIAAVTTNGVIGVENKLPFDYPEDMKHFRTTTANSLVVMGRKTFESIGRPLPKRRNIVISKIAYGLGTLSEEGIEIVPNFEAAMGKKYGDERNMWIIGGASVYERGMEYADKIVLTLTPDYVDTRKHDVARFPWINPSQFELKSIVSLFSDDATSKLRIATYEKIIS